MLFMNLTKQSVGVLFASMYTVCLLSAAGTSAQ
jgi:hypothetical protein